jgi:parallel beta-helix repeat protein
VAIQHRTVTGTYTVNGAPGYGNVWARLSETIHSTADGDSEAPDWIIATLDEDGAFSASWPVTDDPDVYTGSGRTAYMRVIENVGRIAPRNYKVEIAAGGTPLNLALIPHLNDGSEDYAIRGGEANRLTDYLVDKGIQYWAPIPTGITPNEYYNHVRYDDLGRALDGTLEDYLTSADLEGGLLVVSADLANTSDPAKGDALVGFKQTDTGGVAGTVHSKLLTMLSVSDFGAVGDGVTHDSAALQALLSAVAARGGGVARLQDGKRYYIDTPLQVANPVVIEGGALLAHENGRLLMPLSSNVTLRGVEMGLRTPFATTTVSDMTNSSGTVDVADASGFVAGGGMKAYVWDNTGTPQILGISSVVGNTLHIAPGGSYTALAGAEVSYGDFLGHTTVVVTQASTTLTLNTGEDISWLSLLVPGSIIYILDSSDVQHPLVVSSVVSPVVNFTQSGAYSVFSGNRITNGLYTESVTQGALTNTSLSVVVAAIGLFAPANPAGTVNAEIMDDVGHWRGVSVTGIDAGTRTVSFVDRTGDSWTAGVGAAIRSIASAQVLARKSVGDPTIGNFGNWCFDKCRLRNLSLNFTKVGRVALDGRTISSGTDIVSEVAVRGGEVYDYTNSYGVEFGAVVGADVIGVHIHHIGDGAPGSPYGEAIKVTAASEKVRIIGNHIHHNNRDGIDGFDAGQAIFLGNDVHDNMGSGCEFKWSTGEVSSAHVGRSVFASNRFTRNRNGGAGLYLPNVICANNYAEDNGRSPYAVDTYLFPPVVGNATTSIPVLDATGLTTGLRYVGPSWLPITVTGITGNTLTVTAIGGSVPFALVGPYVTQSLTAGSVQTTLITANVTAATTSMYLASLAGLNTNDNIYVQDNTGVWRLFKIVTGVTGTPNMITVKYSGPATFTANIGNVVALDLTADTIKTAVSAGITQASTTLRVINAVPFSGQPSLQLRDDTGVYRTFTITGVSTGTTNQTISGSFPGTAFTASGGNFITTITTPLSTSAYGIRLDGRAQGSDDTFNQVCIGNIANRNAMGGIFVKNSSKTKIIGNTANDNLSFDGIYLTGTVVDALVMGNTAFGNVRSGIRAGGSRVQITGNRTQDANGAAVLVGAVEAVSINGYGSESGSGAPTGTWPVNAQVNKTGDGSVWRRTLTTWELLDAGTSSRVKDMVLSGSFVVSAVGSWESGYTNIIPKTATITYSDGSAGTYTGSNFNTHSLDYETQVFTHAASGKTITVTVVYDATFGTALTTAVAVA